MKGKGKQKKKKPGTHGWCVRVRPPHTLFAGLQSCTLLGEQLQKCELSGHRGSPRARVLGDGAQDRMCFITVNNDPEYCLGLPYLGALGAARCRQPSRKRQSSI